MCNRLKVARAELMFLAASITVIAHKEVPLSRNTKPTDYGAINPL